MQTIKKIKRNGKVLGIVLILIAVAIGCSKSEEQGSDDGEARLADSYTGAANFGITGDTTMTFMGKLKGGAKLTTLLGVEQLELRFEDEADIQIRTFFSFIFSGDPKRVTVRTYTLSSFDVNTVFTVFEIYGETTKNHMGTVTITALNRDKITGSVDMKVKLDDGKEVTIKGNFELTGQ